METLPGGFTLTVPEDCFPLSTDSMALADFVKLPRSARILDLGSGCGNLGLLLAAKDCSCRITGIEISETSHLAALKNIHANHLEDRMESLCRDLRQVPALLKPGSYSVCVSNPPYFSGGPASLRFQNARREDSCSSQDLFTAAAWALKFGGDFFLVHRPEKLGELMGKAAAHGFECKRLGLLKARQDGPVTLILLQMRKGAKPGLILEETCLHDSFGNRTEDYIRIYHMEET